MFRKILVALELPTDNTPTFEAGVELALGCKASLVLLHILSGEEDWALAPAAGTLIDLYPLGANRETHEYFHQQWKLYESRGMQMLQEHKAQALERGIPTEIAQVAGHPGPLICEMARTWDVDAIVIGRRGRRGVAEALLGSVSNHVVHHAPCSVLVVQPPCDVAEHKPAEQVTSRDASSMVSP